jgi:hypothetical protein
MFNILIVCPRAGARHENGSPRSVASQAQCGYQSLRVNAKGSMDWQSGSRQIYTWLSTRKGLQTRAGLKVTEQA